MIGSRSDSAAPLTCLLVFLTGAAFAFALTGGRSTSTELSLLTSGFLTTVRFGAGTGASAGGTVLLTVAVRALVVLVVVGIGVVVLVRDDALVAAGLLAMLTEWPELSMVMVLKKKASCTR